MNELITKQLLFNFFEGQTTFMQRKLIEQWLEDSANEETYYRCLDEWERGRPQVLVDPEKAQQEYDRFLAGGALPEKRSEEMFLGNKRLPVFHRSWIALLTAASLIFGLASLFRDDLMYKTFESPTGHFTSFFLCDSTEVTLNSNSVLKVPRFGFGKEVRQVWLEGEAEFKVTHQKDNLRFQVLMGYGYRIEVLGTEFNAFSRARGKRVFLEKGKVKLNLPKGQEVYLSPGNYFTADAKGSFQVITPDEPLAITAWKEQTFYFEDVTLTEVVEQINERFAAHIKIADRELAARKIGGIYQAKDPDALLQILSAMFEMDIIRHDEEIELRSPKNPDL
ncbi:FecR domain-containing protein [Dyadobacter chenwenxiniae]|uniref:FecR domain-containing protein n=1 Tax=Dyadobacter chenwenxiniae TaxID=2906456 RepID=A0A9X1TD19_9BACT|nr:FecR domain-containing protein [Dyadobacter chenwenxiniae]MCF0060747.1 FecR domain-containing protein [Dyadobacter chenwenxiniae]UON80581.1 FecR domain-containing protein [Dyadobacter chenwenxiniae]